MHESKIMEYTARPCVLAQVTDVAEHLDRGTLARMTLSADGVLHRGDHAATGVEVTMTSPMYSSRWTSTAMTGSEDRRGLLGTSSLNAMERDLEGHLGGVDLVVGAVDEAALMSTIG